jgi:hypothetical protein
MSKKEPRTSQHRRGVRLAAGRGKQTLTDQEMREREIVRVTREVLNLEREQRKLKKRLKEIGKELRTRRKYQKHLIRPLLPAEDLGVQS